MIPVHSLIAISGIVAFLSAIAFTVFVLAVVSMHRTARVPLSEAGGDRAGALSRRVLIGARPGGREAGE
jgi:hypothetical protein